MEKRSSLKPFELAIGVLLVLTTALYAKDRAPEPTTKQYTGSEACMDCHNKHYKGWKSTLHARMEQEVIREGPNRNVLGDFSSKDPDLTFSLDEVDMLVGSRFKQRYAKRIGDDYYMLPAQWTVATKEWARYQPKKDWWAREGIYPSEWNRRPYSRLCQGCHTTGYNMEKKTPAERNIGCEACHGPGSLHAENENGADIVNPARLDNRLGNMVCFQCHMSGRPPPGPFERYAWPVGYEPGKDLTEFWRYERPTGINGYEMWADGYAHKNRVQGNTFIQSKMYKKGVRCFTCHDSHGSRHVSFTARSAETNSLCLTCHGEGSLRAIYQTSVSEHTRHKPESPGSRCIECHMPKTGKNAMHWDARDHSFTLISPKETIRLGVPNGCNNCHEDKSPEWALAEIVKWQFE